MKKIILLTLIGMLSVYGMDQREESREQRNQRILEAAKGTEFEYLSPWEKYRSHNHNNIPHRTFTSHNPEEVTQIIDPFMMEELFDRCPHWHNMEHAVEISERQQAFTMQTYQEGKAVTANQHQEAKAIGEKQHQETKTQNRNQQLGALATQSVISVGGIIAQGTAQYWGPPVAAFVKRLIPFLR